MRDLMIEQCKDGYGFVTVYRGSRAQLQAASVPDAAFPIDGQSVAEFVFETAHACSTGNVERLDGWMRATAEDGCFEFEVQWGVVMPYSCAHPAIAELARMLLIDIRRWADGNLLAEDIDPTYPIEALIRDKRATGFKPLPGAPRVQVTPEFQAQLAKEASRLFDFVHRYGEVVPCTEEAAKHRPQGSLKLVVDNGHQVQS